METRGDAARRLRAVPAPGADRLTLEDVAAELHCSRATVFRLLDAGAFPSIKVGRRRLVDRSDVDAYVQRLKPPPIP